MKNKSLRNWEARGMAESTERKAFLDHVKRAGRYFDAKFDCNQVCKYNTPDRGCVAGELWACCDLANVTGERGNGEAG